MIDSAHTSFVTRRGGLSILEFVGCLSAMIGGVLLGSYYLGVDVKDMGYAVLERAHIVDPRPTADDDDDATPAQTAAAPAVAAPLSPGLRPGVAPRNSSQDPPRAEPGAEPLTAPRPATASAPRATAAVPAPAPSEAPEAAAAVPQSPPAGFFARPELLTDEQRKVLTLAYWDALAICMRDELDNRTPAIDKEGNWQLFDYLTGRKEGHVKAAEAIGALDPRGVDDHVFAYAKKARAWHADGAKLFGRAVDLLTDAPTAQLSGPFAQSWQSASTQHRMEERLLTEKHQAVQNYLDHTYGDGESTDSKP
jgi:hypothetical protein